MISLNHIIGLIESRKEDIISILCAVSSIHMNEVQRFRKVIVVVHFICHNQFQVRLLLNNQIIRNAHDNCSS